MEKKKLPEIVLRTITSIFYGALLVTLIFLNNKYFAIAISGLASIFVVWEYFLCVDLKKSPYMIFGLFLSILTTTSLLLYQELVFEYFPLTIIFVFLITCLIGILFSNKYEFKHIPISIFGYIYSIFIIMFIPKIFFLEQGNIKLALLILLVSITDTFAFLIGRKIGKHKFTKISPNKSIEGVISGILAAIIFSLIYTFIVNKYFNFNLNYYIIIIVAILLSIIAQIGDLVASYIKRAYNKKDFGKILVGVGGVLDRIDSIIFTAPFAYLIFSLIM